MSRLLKLGARRYFLFSLSRELPGVRGPPSSLTIFLFHVLPCSPIPLYSCILGRSLYCRSCIVCIRQVVTAVTLRHASHGHRPDTGTGDPQLILFGSPPARYVVSTVHLSMLILWISSCQCASAMRHLAGVALTPGRTGLWRPQIVEAVFADGASWRLGRQWGSQVEEHKEREGWRALRRATWEAHVADRECHAWCVRLLLHFSLVRCAHWIALLPFL